MEGPHMPCISSHSDLETNCACPCGTGLLQTPSCGVQSSTRYQLFLSLVPHGGHGCHCESLLPCPAPSLSHMRIAQMTESTVFKGTKLVTPADSYRFFADLYDLGNRMTNGRFSTYEIDFLLSNFAGSASMTEHVGAADQWYAGMAHAARERNITIQYCLPSATDMLVSLAHPAVVQARASSDYVATENNVAELGGSSLLMGATV